MAKMAMSMKMSMKMKTMAMAKMSMAKKMKKGMKVSIIAKGKYSKVAVFKGKKVKTVGGLKKGDLIKSKTGKIVSKKQSIAGKKVYAKYLSAWTVAFKKARKELGLKGFVAPKKGSKFYATIKKYYKK